MAEKQDLSDQAVDAAKQLAPWSTKIPWWVVLIEGIVVGGIGLMGSSLLYLALVLVFMAVGLQGFRYLKLSEQRSIWVGMAKETAHQIGTPLSSLLGWVALLRMEDANEDGVWKFATTGVPAGAWEYKAALNNSWTENYGAGGVQDGPNILLSLAAGTDVKFYYDHESHWVTDSQNSVIATVPGSFQDELGCPGDWDPACLRSWLQDADGDGIYAQRYNADGSLAGSEFQVSTYTTGAQEHPATALQRLRSQSSAIATGRR